MNNFDSLSIMRLDGRIQSTLDWSNERKEAAAFAVAGKKIVWQMELGLFSGLDMPLSNQMQMQSLNLAIEHFRDTLWKDFQTHSLGLIIYTGDLDFSMKFPWDEILYNNWQGWLQDRFDTINSLNIEIEKNFEGFQDVHPQLSNNALLLNLVKLFCRDTASDYLNTLVTSISDSLPLYLKIRSSHALDTLLFYQLCTKERFERFHIIFDKDFCESPISSSLMDPKGLMQNKEAKIGICMPNAEIVQPSRLKNLESALAQLVHANILFRAIPEDHLIHQWEGLEAIVYSSKCLGGQGKRKLQGFCAADGLAVAVDETIGLPNEISIENFIKNL